MTYKKEGFDDPSFWCTRPSTWEHIILPNATTWGDVDTPWSWDGTAARRLQEAGLNDEQAKLLDADAELRQSNRDKKKADLPPPYFGFNIVEQGMNQGLKTATFQFTRPFAITNATAARVTMDLDHEKNYTLLMNWGVFKSHDDDSAEYLYGARKMSHA